MSTPSSAGPSGSSSIPRSLDLLIPLLFAVTSAIYFLSDNEADNDLWVHLLTGREILAGWALPTTDAWSFTTLGSPWVDHEWLAQVLFAVVFGLAGDTGVWLLKVLIGLTTASLLWRIVARRTDTPWIRATVITLAVAVMGRGFAMRPQIFTYLATAVLLDWLDRRDAGAPRPHTGVREILGTVMLFALWANAHGGFVFGLGVLALYQSLPPWHGWRSRVALLIAAGVGTCINPYGASLLTYIGHELQTPHPITEWQAAAPGDPALFSYFVFLAAWVVTIPFSTSLQRRPWYVALAAATVVLSLRHQRHAPLLALCAAAPLAEQLQGGLAWLQRRSSFTLSSASMRLITLSVAALALLQLAFTVARIAGDGPHVVYDARDYPVDAMRYVRSEGLRGNMAVPLDWGGYVLWHGTPEVRVSLDGRFATVYPPAAVTSNFAFYGDGPSSEATRLIDQYGATMVLAPAGWRTAAHGRPSWEVRYRDDVAELLVLGSAGEPVVGRAVVGRLRFP